MESRAKGIKVKHVEGKGPSTSKVYFSCPRFTVLLTLKGTVIVTAAPVAKAFEGQTIDALTSWARTRFGGPIVVQRLS
jgi:hypothetical protein